MKMVHTYLRREYSLSPDLVRGVVNGNRARAELIASHIEFISLTLSEHHGAEDKHIWPKLLERCPADLAPLIHLVEHQHEGVADALGALPAVLAPWRESGDVERGETVAVPLDGLVAALFEHLQTEEERVLPLIEQHISADEWRTMVAEGAAQIPPEKAPVLFGMVMYEGDSGAVEDALENIPAEVRDGLREAAPRAYAAYAEQLYGTPTPPRIGTRV
jgi:hemerythrin-like domain-containing protein